MVKLILHELDAKCFAQNSKIESVRRSTRKSEWLERGSEEFDSAALVPSLTNRSGRLCESPDAKLGTQRYTGTKT